MSKPRGNSLYSESSKKARRDTPGQLQQVRTDLRTGRVSPQPVRNTTRATEVKVPPPGTRDHGHTSVEFSRR
jgi:hypothetical protein